MTQCRCYVSCGVEQRKKKKEKEMLLSSFTFVVFSYFLFFFPIFLRRWFFGNFAFPLRSTNIVV